VSHPAVLTSNVQCVHLSAGDALLKCVVTKVVLVLIVAFRTLTFHKVVQRQTCGVLGSLV